MSTEKKHSLQNLQQRAIEILMRYKALFILLVLVLIAACLSPNFLSARNITNILKQVAAATIMGMGFTLVIGSGHMDLSVGYLLGMLGIIAAKLDTTTQLPFGCVILLVALIGAVSGMANAFFVGAFSLPPFIVTLAMGQVFKGVNYVVSNTSAISGLGKPFIFMGQGSIGIFPMPVVLSVLITVIISIVVYRSAFGRHVISLGSNPVAARVSGLNVKRIRYGVYCIMGICTAVAALVLTGRAASAQPQSGQGMEMDAIAAVIIGGTALGGGNCKPEGTFFGCLIVGLISNILNLMSVNSNWQWVAKGAIILFAVIIDSQSEKVLERQRIRALK